MTATDELRQLLEERGEYYRTSGNRTWWGRPIDAKTGKPIDVFHNQAQPMGEDRLLVELQLATPEQAIAATVGCGECREVWLLMATDVENGREEVLGAYSSKGAAEAAISENRFGYALHDVQRWEVE